MKTSRIHIAVILALLVVAAPAVAKLIAAVPQKGDATATTAAPSQPTPAESADMPSSGGEAAVPSSGGEAAAASSSPCPEIKPGDFGGVGMSLHEVEGEGVSVLHAIEGLPADKAGLRIGDKLIAVDGKPVAGMQMCELIALIRGPSGSVVNITVKHIRDDAPVTLPVTRELIQGH